MYRDNAGPPQFDCARCGQRHPRDEAFLDLEGATVCRSCNSKALVAGGAADVRKVAEGEPLQNFFEGVGFALVLVPLAGVAAATVGLVFHSAFAAVVGSFVCYLGGAVLVAMRARRRWTSYGLTAVAVLVMVGFSVLLGVAR
jgi:DNA-directed RNA polymerase subunit RPC12/RpoP